MQGYAVQVPNQVIADWVEGLSFVEKILPS